jgi:hypothetical protein
MGTILHCCIDIRGMLKWSKPKLRGAFRDASGRPLTADEVREHLFDCLAEGKKVLPLGEECEGFSYQTGCPGHREDAPAPGEVG